MKIIFKKTTELSDSEIKGFLSCYGDVFDMNESVEDFKNEYLYNCLGYSLHSFMYNESNEICGGFCVIPIKYEVCGQEYLFGTGADFMIKKDCGSQFTDLVAMMSAPFKFMKENGFTVYYGFPNDNAEVFDIRLLRCKRIKLLDTYILPYKLGDYKKKLAILNPLSMLLGYCMIGLSNFSRNNEEVRYKVKKVQPIFDKTRYKWFNPKEYHHYNEDGINAVWKISDFEGIKACFLMDVYPMSKVNFDKSVRAMFKTEKKNSGLFLYVGNLPFCPSSMIKIPRKVEPKKFRFDVKVIDKDIDKDVIYNPDNWEVSLASYDLL